MTPSIKLNIRFARAYANGSDRCLEILRACEEVEFASGGVEGNARTRRDGTGRVNPASGFLGGVIRKETGCTDSSRYQARPAGKPCSYCMDDNPNCECDDPPRRKPWSCADGFCGADDCTRCSPGCEDDE